VVDEVLDGNPRGEFRDTSHVISVIVSRHQVIDLRSACILDGFEDAAGVTGCRAVAVSRIDEQRFAGRGDEQRRAPALDVDDVDPQISAGLRQKRDGRSKRAGERDQEQAHGTPHGEW
jgi:hypothetical protein